MMVLEEEWDRVFRKRVIQILEAEWDKGFIKSVTLVLESECNQALKKTTNRIWDLGTLFIWVLESHLIHQF